MPTQPSTAKFRGTRTPAGLILRPPAARLRGRFRWQVLGLDGRPEQPVDPRGRPIRYRGEWHPNLITDVGLDRIGQVHMWNPTTANPSQNGFRGYLALGTGSAAPATTDATLDTEVQRGNTNGATANPVFSLETGDDVIRSVGLRDVQIVMTADRNLTEYGLSDASSGGAVSIRELFRDELGDPVTISLLNGKTLRLQHELTIEIAAPAAGTVGTLDIEEYDAANALIGTTEYDLAFGPTGDVAQAFHAWSPSNQRWDTTLSISLFAWRLTSGSYNRSTMVPGTGVPNTTGRATPAAYVGGSYERLKRASLNATDAQYNGVWNGIGFYGGVSGGAAFCFTDPLTFTKLNTHTLRVGMLSTWARG